MLLCFNRSLVVGFFIVSLSALCLILFWFFSQFSNSNLGAVNTPFVGEVADVPVSNSVNPVAEPQAIESNLSLPARKLQKLLASDLLPDASAQLSFKKNIKALEATLAAQGHAYPEAYEHSATQLDIQSRLDSIKAKLAPNES